ncbi:hypothetical protein CIL05_04885 [Virgibacillus profundi]|uniref:Uncharacterized protein n=1 Tax=Virgibacillus profundi TaxID=2024555 RepID=A0A2A2IGR8_9BACI|nr:hypothetical protein CIL05_04885 [Virgibacillus profundi]PXY54616.1 hypothetical protein CIT14_04970 [Virgibacillus profundi]
MPKKYVVILILSFLLNITTIIFLFIQSSQINENNMFLETIDKKIESLDDSFEDAIPRLEKMIQQN